MVAPNQSQTVTAPGSLEPLNQEESRFLTQYFRDCKEDLLAWSAATNIPIDALAKWLNDPRIAAYITALRHHQAQAAKRRCIDLLTAVIDSDEPLPEKRRAATTLLRAITPAGRGAARRAARDEPDHDNPPGHQGRISEQHEPAARDNAAVLAVSSAAETHAHEGTHHTNGAHCHHQSAQDPSHQT